MAVRVRPDGAPGLMVRPRPELPIVSLGFQLVDWAEVMLCHGPGDLAEEPLEFDDELVAFIVGAYALDPGNGRRLVREAVLSRAKGRAKSEVAAVLVCIEGLGPARFDHWAAEGEVSSWGYQYEVGEPVGRRVKSPFVRVLATEEGQTGNTYDNVHLMLTKGHIANDPAMRGLDVGLTRTLIPGGGKIEPCTAGAASKDGGKETFAVADEVHLYTLPNLRSMYRTVSRNLTKRRAAEPWMLCTTTWFSPGEQSIAEAKAKEAESVADGRAKNLGLYYDHLHAIPPADPTDDRAIIKALKVAAGAGAKWMDHQARLADIRRPETDWDDACRYYFNTLSANAEDFLELVLWRALAGGAPLERRQTVALGFDGSDSGGDLTALVAIRWPDWHIVRLASWERPTMPRGDDIVPVPNWQVPRLEVHEAVADAFSRYNVVRMFADPPYWRTEVATWQSTYGAKVVAFPTFADSKMVPACDLFVSKARAGGMSHDGDPLLDASVGNAGRTRTRTGLRPEKKSPTRHIDPLVAAICAAAALNDAVAKGEVTAYAPPATSSSVPANTDKSLYRPTERLKL